ncbi:hypothetical protein VTH06DRAFT_3309 [Thermothelomyces fergusii]
MPGASVAVMPASAASTPATRKTSHAPERKYKCQFCNRAFSRSEHRSRHERSHTKERPFKCMKCRSTFVRRDLLLRHDRTVHAKDGGVPLHSDGKRRGGPKTARSSSGPSKSAIAIDTSTLEQIEASSDGVFDVETAAMLVADLHQKATAAAKANGHYDGNSSMSFSQSESAMMEPSVTYPNGAIGLPQWDGFVSQEPKTHSIGSAASTSFDGPNAAGQLRNSNVVAPGLQALVNSLPPSATGTPAPQSPYQAPRGHTPADASQPPSGFKAPQIHNDEERNVVLDNIRSHDSEHAIPEGFRVPNLASLNRYLATYFGLFHHHLPFLHPASFEPTRVSPALLLAVLSIGALYAFDQEQAYMLHIGSKVLVNQARS